MCASELQKMQVTLRDDLSLTTHVAYDGIVTAFSQQILVAAVSEL